jgi:hypothetical protein
MPAINPGSADTAYPTTCWHLSLSTNKKYARNHKKTTYQNIIPKNNS